MNVKNNTYIFLEKIKNFFQGNSINSKLKCLKTSFFAIVFGLLLAIFFIFVSGFNGFSFLGVSISKAFNFQKFGIMSNIEKVILYFSIYSLLGFGLALGFKVGIFNMGGSGQALFGLMFTILIIQSIADKNGITFGEVNKINVILVFICFILMGTIISALSGLLKVFFNIHEVATTILLNYVTYFLLKWVININGDHWGNTSPGLNYNWLSLFGIVWLLPVLLVILSGLCISLILYFTKWGFRYKAVGSSPTASKYAGINEKLYIIIITIAQGILMSMGGFIYYFGVAYSQSIQTDNIPTLGYDAIAIALIAFNNFLGIPFVSFLWAIFQVGFKAAQSTAQFVNLSNQTSTLVFGLITYSAAIYIIFYKIEFIRWINDNIIKYNDIYLRKLIKDKKIILKNYKTNQKDLFKKKSDTTLHDLHLLSKKIKTIKSEISDLKINRLNEYKNNSILAIKSLYKQNNNKINSDFFENLLKIKNSSSLNKKDNKKLYKETLLKNYNELIKNYKKTKNNNFKSYKEALTQLKTYIKTYQINIFKKNILKLDKKNDNYKKMIEDEKIKFFDLKKEVFNKYAW